jgi:Tfp pilus assembly protein PilV
VKTRRAQSGLSFIELVASIVIISVATFGLMLAVTSTVNRSANPMVETQAAAVAGAYLEEAMLADLRANHADILKGIRDSRDFSDDSKKALVAALDKFTKTFA